MRRTAKSQPYMSAGKEVLAQIIRAWGRGSAITMAQLSQLTAEYSKFKVSNTAFSALQRAGRPNPGGPLFIAMEDLNIAAAAAQAEMPPNTTPTRPIERLKVITVNGKPAEAGDFLKFFCGVLKPDNDFSDFKWTESMMEEAIVVIRDLFVERCFSIKRSPLSEAEVLANIGAEAKVIAWGEVMAFRRWLLGLAEELDPEVTHKWLEGFSLIWESWSGSPLDPRSLIGPKSD